MICSFCKSEILDDKFFKSRDTKDCVIHNECLMDKLPAFPHKKGGLKFTEEELDNLVELIIAARLK